MLSQLHSLLVLLQTLQADDLQAIAALKATLNEC